MASEPRIAGRCRGGPIASRPPLPHPILGFGYEATDIFQLRISLCERRQIPLRRSENSGTQFGAARHFLQRAIGYTARRSSDAEERPCWLLTLIIIFNHENGAD